MKLKTQIMIKFKDSNFDETKNSNCDKTRKNQIVMKLKRPDCDETQKFIW